MTYSCRASPQRISAAPPITTPAIVSASMANPRSSVRSTSAKSKISWPPLRGPVSRPSRSKPKWPPSPISRSVRYRAGPRSRSVAGCPFSPQAPSGSLRRAVLAAGRHQPRGFPHQQTAIRRLVPANSVDSPVAGRSGRPDFTELLEPFGPRHRRTRPGMRKASHPAPHPALSTRSPRPGL